MSDVAESHIELETARPTHWRRAVGVGVITGLLPVALVVTCYLQQGFVAAGRCATDLVMPVAGMWMGLLACTIWHASLRNRGPAFAFFGLFALWSIVGNGYFNRSLMSRVEAPLVTDPNPAFEKWTTLPDGREGQLPLDAAVTLGGSAGLITDGFAEVYRDGERIVSAAQAYHAGMTQTIITTGTSSDGIGNPSEVGRELLVSLNVPDEHIFSIEGENTSQEMASLAEFLQNPPQAWLEQINASVGEKYQIGLITSAFHIPRAIRLAKTNGLDLIPLPCAFRNEQTNRPFLAASLVPNAEHLANFGQATKEILAWFLGR
ncbi:YdcF family protein [Aporhodopirellula rubra]|uniref:YdcF family protein n=1 Tax=Aporhodopirellula rubra TaxID=980271 RepID=UPI00160BCE98|nr:YdcF family protein [Aporhodopirellula rubra]